MPEKDQGLVTIRMENILTWGEHVQVDRGTDEEDVVEEAKLLGVYDFFESIHGATDANSTVCS